MIATRNRVAFLPRALQSVYQQDYPRLEVLVVDDASEDGTSDYIRSNYPKIRLFRYEENRGLIVARNLMMREAKGKYVISLDDDAYFINADAISRAVRRMEDEPEVGVIGFRIVQRGKEESPGEMVERYSHVFIGCGHCLRKAILGRTGYYREFLFHQGEEQDLALRLIDSGYRILFFPEARVFHDFTPVARDPERIPMYNARNLLLRSWLNEPFPYWVLSTGNTLVKCLAGGAKIGNLGYVLRGFWGAIRELSRVRALRRPISAKGMRLYLTLRSAVVTDASEVRRQYEAPPSFLKALLGSRAGPRRKK